MGLLCIAWATNIHGNLTLQRSKQQKGVTWKFSNLSRQCKSKLANTIWNDLGKYLHVVSIQSANSSIAIHSIVSSMAIIFDSNQISHPGSTQLFRLFISTFRFSCLFSLISIYAAASFSWYELEHPIKWKRHGIALVQKRIYFESVNK